MLSANRQTALQPEGRMRPVVVIASERTRALTAAEKACTSGAQGLCCETDARSF